MSDQLASARFYEHVLAPSPSLNVPGMTEYELGNGAILGLLPVQAAGRMLGLETVDPEVATRVSRMEVYLVVHDPLAYHLRALDSGAEELSPLAPRSWGHDVAYSRDIDGHIIAFARPIPRPDAE